MLSTMMLLHLHLMKLMSNRTLYDDAVQGDLEVTERLVKEDNKVCIYPLNDKLQNVFHIISKREEEEEDERVVEKLENIVRNMSVDDLGKKDGDGRTALHVTALYGNTKMAQVFIRKNCRLLFVSDGHHDLPVHLAARNIRQSEAVYTFFFNVTRQKCEEVQVPTANPFELSSAMQLFCYLIGSKFYDLALDLVVKYDELGVSVAEIPGSKLDEKNPDVASHPLLKSKTSALQALVQFDCPIINTSHLSFWHNSISYLWQPKSMKNKMSMHRKAEKLLHHLCNRIKSRKDHKQVVAVAKSAMFEAARLDMDTVVTSILDTCPTIVYCLDDNKCSVFHIAVENRSENVFNLLCQKSIQMRDLAEMVDVHGNGILHLAGKLAPPHKLNSVSGAALQMQLELQWFEVIFPL
ncbi:unnamed protein product [Cuscuta campestris]|uniref:Uncharacterized protein n=1 Tax=Cuscuta campestris TaxID=132261 RepID=A0A484N799_9ASTE|nr:unnamed protein product [Cuscuta campestris]VFQ96399.1 unnamed protein product [Cuscuta campestris]